MSSSNPLKRPATEAPTASAHEAKKRGRPKKSDDHVENEHARANAIWLKENCMPFEMADVDSRVGELFRHPGNGWTESLEQSMNRMWQDGIYSEAKDRLTEAVKKKKGTTTPQLLNLWKICLRVLKVTPVRLISFLELLEYHPDRAHLDVFSKQFCTSLASLILHPAMKAKKQRIVICLQYAVLCRIDDRRIWPLSSSTSKCPVITAMIGVMKQAKDRKSHRPIHDVLVSCYSACEEKGEKPSGTANLLRRIGETVRSSMPGPEVDDDMLAYRGRRVYPVSLHDLRIVIKTLDETEWEDESWRCTAQESYDSYISLNFCKGDIPHWRQLTEHYERSHKNTLREWMLQTGFSPDDDGPSGSRESPEGSTYQGGFESDHEGGLGSSLRPDNRSHTEFAGNQSRIEDEGDLEVGDLPFMAYGSPRTNQGSETRGRSPPVQSPVALSNNSQRWPLRPTEAIATEPELIQVSSETFRAMELHIKNLERKVEAFEGLLRPLQRSHEELQRKVKFLETGAFNRDSSRNGPAHSSPNGGGIMNSDQHHLTELPDTLGLSAEHSWAPVGTPPPEEPRPSSAVMSQFEPDGQVSPTGCRSVLSQTSANSNRIVDVKEERRLAYRSVGLLDLGRVRELYQQRSNWDLPDPVMGCPVGIGRSRTHCLGQRHPEAVNRMANSERVAQLVQVLTKP
ncbi:hypothetical protein BFJ72_g2593 [Fusarium proliferatum]|uniref:Uncharacterized protein n=1 Tax=Gibberella intermedia TaxID=948311 RepID=A0A420TZB5_GIBIN|nr:hypothetical protein BFJ72_g2593 [Fusarium proliferatum]